VIVNDSVSDRVPVPLSVTVIVRSYTLLPPASAGDSKFGAPVFQVTTPVVVSMSNSAASVPPSEYVNVCPGLSSSVADATGSFVAVPFSAIVRSVTVNTGGSFTSVTVT
jgi:hypothetical protein